MLARLDPAAQPAAAVVTRLVPGQTIAATTASSPTLAAADPSAPVVKPLPPITKPEPGKPAPATREAMKPEPTATVEPRGPAGLINQGNKLLERGKAKEAQKLFEKALEDQPANIEALNGLAYCYVDTERYGAAVDRFKQVLAIMSSNGEAIIGIAEVYKLRGDKTRALEYYKKYLAVLPSGSKARMAQTNITELEAALKRNAVPEGSEVRDTPTLLEPTPQQP